MSDIRVAILGCGKVAHLHAKALEQIEKANLKAVWSRTFSSAEKFSAHYGVAAYQDINLMIREEGIQMVIVCTPHPFHLQPVLESLEAGAHVLVEKPLASSLADCDQMISIAKRTSKRLGVISQRRWYPAALRVKQAIESNKIGNPVLGTVQMLGWRDRDYYDSDDWRGTWNEEGGGVLVNQSPHQLDLLLWYMGAIDEVYGTWSNLNHPYIEVEDTALAIIKFRNGALGNIIVSNSQKPGIYGKVHIHGQNGATVGVQTESGAMFIAGRTGISEPAINDLWTVPGEERLLEKWKEADALYFNKIDPTIHFIQLQIEDFLTSIREGHDPVVSGETGRDVVELFTAIYRSHRDGKPIKFPLLPEIDRMDYDGRITLGERLNV